MRLIPAHAGKTPASRRRGPSEQAHPRSRGENIMEQTADAHGAGSSPLTRGKRGRAPATRVGNRLIPAHAGKTHRRTDPSRSGTAHPRSRGENDTLSRVTLTARGSSPLTRGKLPGLPHDLPRGRLIPAHAGKTASRSSSAASTAAHPRSRGENANWLIAACDVAGSSPLTRGKHRRPDGKHLGPGLIPAHAGKTSNGILAALRGTAHPRSRGENAVQKVEDGSTAGSSPLTRGKPRSHPGCAWSGRLIPAHAGKTSIWS